MSLDFLDRLELALTSQAVAVAPQGESGTTAAPFTGLRCDAVLVAPWTLGGNVSMTCKCGASFAGDTSGRAARRALILRAEAAGWQAVHVDGVSMQFCPEHTDPDRLRLRRLK